MSFEQAIAMCMGKYFTFSGRAKKSEYWWFYLFTVLMSWGALVVDNFSPQPFSGTIVSLTFSIPVVAAGSRRLHDVGKSGWWQLLMLTVIGAVPVVVWLATDSKPEGDKYGESVPLAGIPE